MCSSDLGKRVMVVATPLTVHEKRLQKLVERVDDEHLVDMLELPGLVEFAEQGEFVSARVTAYLQEKFGGYALEQYGELVLGCTHFNYFKDTFRALLPQGIHIIDGSLGTVRQLMRVLAAKGALAPQTAEEAAGGQVRYFASGREILEADRLERIRKLHERLEQMRAL